MADETADLMRRLNRELLEAGERNRATIARVRALAEHWTANPPESITDPARQVLDALTGGGPMPWGETHALISRAAIECVLVDHADELNDAKGRVDPNLADLAYEYRALTGFDAQAARAVAESFAAQQSGAPSQEEPTP